MKRGFRNRITRRDFLNGVALGAGSCLLARMAPGLAARPGSDAGLTLGVDWYGYGGVGDYRQSHGNTPEAIRAAHRLRDRGFDLSGLDFDTAEEHELVIVGCGMAGLGAGLEYSKRRQAGQSCLMLDNHPLFGGEAKENEFRVDGVTLIAPQGANGFFVPPRTDDPARSHGDARYYAELEIPRELPYRAWPSSERPLEFCRDNYGYLVRGLQEQTSVGHFFAGGGGPGRWAVDMWQNALADTPLEPAERRSMLRWYRAGNLRPFGSAGAAMAFLDRMSYRELLENELKLGPAGARYADLFLASAVGLGSDAVSAYAASQLPMPGLSDPPASGLRRQSFPGGNSGFARYFLKALIPGAIAGEHAFGDIVTGRINFAALDCPGQALRMRLNATVVAVRHRGASASAPYVEIAYLRDGQLHPLRAKAVIMATGGWINRHVVRDLPDEQRRAYEQFNHAPFLVANVALNNWRFLYRLGITAAIWEHGEDDFGYTCNIRRPMTVGRHQPPLDPNRPIVLSFYTPFFYPGLAPRAQTARGRMELLQTPFADFESAITKQMLKLFGSAGFDPQKDVAGVILNRWGHAYSVPYPGFYTGLDGQPPARDVIRHGFGRVAFAHSELAGLQHWGPAADEGRRAFGQISDAMLG